MFKRKKVKQYYKDLSNNKRIVKFGSIVHAKNLWAFNRHAIIWGIVIGIMCSWIPMPFHTTIAVIIAIIVDCNIPLVVTSIWFANPITMPFMYYIAYRLGEAVMFKEPPSELAFHPSLKDLMAVFDQVWQPLLLGCLICSIFCGILTYFILNLGWFIAPKTRDRLLDKLK